jgi:hypothetical protein
MHKWASRAGKQQQKWRFECQVCDVRGLPPGVSRAVVVWDRGRKAIMTPPADVHDSYCRWDAQLGMTVTLFSSAKAVDPKLCRLQVYDADRMNPAQLSSRAGLLSSVELDLSECSASAEMTSGGGKVVQLKLQPGSSALASLPRAVLLQVKMKAHVSTVRARSSLLLPSHGRSSLQPAVLRCAQLRGVRACSSRAAQCEIFTTDSPAERTCAPFTRFSAPTAPRARYPRRTPTATTTTRQASAAA